MTGVGKTKNVALEEPESGIHKNIMAGIFDNNPIQQKERHELIHQCILRTAQ